MVQIGRGREIKTTRRLHGHFPSGTTSDNGVQLWWCKNTTRHAKKQNELDVVNDKYRLLASTI
jgi:hypothetical protein